MLNDDDVLREAEYELSVKRVNFLKDLLKDLSSYQGMDENLQRSLREWAESSLEEIKKAL